MKRPINEPALWPNTRTDGAEYADDALMDLLDSVKIKGQRAQALVRDTIAEAFSNGEHQERVRAIRVVAIARANATTPKARAALAAVAQLLSPDVLQ